MYVALKEGRRNDCNRQHLRLAISSYVNKQHCRPATMDLPLDHPIYRRLRMNNATPSPQRRALRATPRPTPVTPSSIPRSYPSLSPTIFGPSSVRRTPATRENERNRAHDLYNDRLESEGNLAFQTETTDDPAFLQWTTHVSASLCVQV